MSETQLPVENVTQKGPRFPWFRPAARKAPPPDAYGSFGDGVTDVVNGLGGGLSGGAAWRGQVDGGTGLRLFFDEGVMRRLDRVQLLSQRMHGAVSHGGRRSKRRGTSVEFADYREYTHGDDLRQIDWNIYGRSERLYVKLREDEESLAVHLLLDCSRSMDFGRFNKLAYAKQLAAALGYVTLAGQDQLEVSAFGERLLNRLPALRAKAQTSRLFAFLADVRPSGATDLKAVLRAYATMSKRSGMAIVISDLLSPDGLDGLAALLDRGFEVTLLHVLDPLELDPEPGGEVELYDRERGEKVRLSLTADVIDAYRLRVESWIEQTEAFCVKRRVRYLMVSTATPLEDLLFRQLRTRRILS